MELKLIVLILAIFYIPQINSFGSKKEISKIDADLFLEDDEGSGDGSLDDDNESSATILRSGSGFDDEDIVNVNASGSLPIQKPSLVPNSESTSGLGHKKGNEHFDQKPDETETTSFITQPAVIGGFVVGFICAILVLTFIVFRYRRRRRIDGDYKQVAKEGPYSAKCEEAYA